MNNKLITTEPVLTEQKPKFQLSNKAKNIIAITGLTIIAIPFFVIGVATAYYNFTLSNLENSYKSAVAAKEASERALCENRKALASFKADGLKDGDEKKRLEEIAKTECPFQKAE